MPSHDTSHEALLESLIVGDLPRDSAHAVAHLKACAECRERLAGFDELSASLDRAGEEERSGVTQAAGLEIAPKDARRIEEWVRARAAVDRAKSRTPRWIGLALAASLIGVIAVRSFWPSASPVAPGERPDVMLGGEQDELRGLTAPDKQDPFAPFTWISRPLQDGEVYRLKVFNLSEPASDPLVISNIGGTQWSWSDAGAIDAPRVAEFLARAPKQIEWLIEILDLSNRPVVSSKSLRAELRD